MVATGRPIYLVLPNLDKLHLNKDNNAPMVTFATAIAHAHARQRVHGGTPAARTYVAVAAASRTYVHVRTEWWQQDHVRSMPGTGAALFKGIYARTYVCIRQCAQEKASVHRYDRTYDNNLQDLFADF